MSHRKRYWKTRNPRSQPRDNYTGAVCVTRCGFRMVPFESLLEMHYLMQRDAFDFGLRDVISQSEKLQYWYDGKFRTWTPDFRIRAGSGERSELVEVKSWSALYPEDQALRAWIHGKFVAIEEAASQEGFKFVLSTEREIRVQPRLGNAELMLGAVSSVAPTDLFKAESALLRLPATTSVPALQEVMGSKHDAFAIALYLAWKGVIRLDPTLKWTRQTVFYRTSRPLS